MVVSQQGSNQINDLESKQRILYIRCHYYDPQTDY